MILFCFVLYLVVPCTQAFTPHAHQNSRNGKLIRNYEVLTRHESSPIEGIPKCDAIVDSRLSDEDLSRCNSLPRLYVGTLPTTFRNDNSTLPSSQLYPRATFALSHDQSHYVSKVMRLFKKKKRPNASSYDGSSPFDLSGCVRVFDGINGEWLVRVNEAADASLQTKESDGTTGRAKKKPNRNKIRNKNNQLIAQCIIQLRSQPSRYTLDSELHESSQASSAPWILFAPIKKNRAKFMIEKCTELGCELFCPIISERTDQSAINSYIGNIDASQSAMGNLYESQQGGGKGSSKKDLDKFALIGIEAAEQCERLTVPTFITSLALPLENTERMSDDCVIQLDDLVKEWIYEGQCKTLMVCRERKDSNDSFVLPVLEALNKHSTSSSEGVAFLIGPEGGWSLEEENLLDKYCAEHPTTIVGISLGSTVLRAETASIMAIGAWMVWKANSHNS